MASGPWHNQTHPPATISPGLFPAARQGFGHLLAPSQLSSSCPSHARVTVGQGETQCMAVPSAGSRVDRLHLPSSNKLCKPWPNKGAAPRFGIVPALGSGWLVMEEILQNCGNRPPRQIPLGKNISNRKEASHE